MACLYCGKEVPFRMRLTGEEHFCCPAHKRMHHEEHSRLGLARLLEEVAPKDEEEAPREPAEEPEAPTLTRTEAPEPIPEPALVSTGQGLRLWAHGHLNLETEARFENFAWQDLAPVEYEAGGGDAPEATTEEAVAFEGQSPAGAPPREESSPLPDLHEVALAESEKSEAEAVDLLEEKPDTSLSKALVARASGVDESRPAEESPAAAVDAGSERTKAAGAGPEESGSTAAPFSNYAAEGIGSAKGHGAQIAAGVVLALCLGAGGYLGLGIGGGERVSSTGKSEQASGGEQFDEWIPGWSEIGQGEEVALFGPSQEWSDYRVEWKSDANGPLAWIFRAADPDNYYALRLDLSRRDAKLVRYTVIDGARSEATEIPVGPTTVDPEEFAIELEVKGSQFRLFVEGHSVADWSDQRLKRGGFGVIRPDSGLAGVDDVKVTQLERNSAQQGRGYWKGIPPDSLPEVTILRGASRQTTELSDSPMESSL